MNSFVFLCYKVAKQLNIEGVCKFYFSGEYTFFALLVVAFHFISMKEMVCNVAFSTCGT